MKTTNWNKQHTDSYNSSKRDFKKNRPVEEPEYHKITGCKVAVWGDDVNGALRKLKKILERDNRQKDLAKQEYYEKPSIKRKRRRDVAKSRWNREVDQRRNSGSWVDAMPADNSWLKSKRKRRKHVTLVDKIKNRNRG